MPKFNAKYVRSALKALNLCKIYDNFNAKYVGSTLKINAKYVKSTPKFNAKYLRLALNALNLCKIYAKVQRYISKIHAKIQRKKCKIDVEWVVWYGCTILSSCLIT